jgi:hypothetical protein
MESVVMGGSCLMGFQRGFQRMTRVADRVGRRQRKDNTGAAPKGTLQGKRIVAPQFEPSTNGLIKRREDNLNSAN